MKTSALHQYLYLITAALLITHEIDSAYWREWQLFGLPGGLPVFLLINLGIALVVLVGFRWLVQGALLGRLLSLVVGLGAVFAVGAHAYFMVTGHQEFREPASIALLAAMLVVAIAQLRVGFGELHPRTAPPSRPMGTANPANPMDETQIDLTQGGLG